MNMKAKEIGSIALFFSLVGVLINRMVAISSNPVGVINLHSLDIGLGFATAGAIGVGLYLIRQASGF